MPTAEQLARFETDYLVGAECGSVQACKKAVIRSWVAYAAAKAALLQMTQTTAVIYAAKGIRLNCVVPGLMFTPLVKRLADKYAEGDYEGFVAHRHQQVPMGRLGDAWDVAHAVLFLASDESRYITAQQIVVDGALTAATR